MSNNSNNNNKKKFPQNKLNEEINSAKKEADKKTDEKAAEINAKEAETLAETKSDAHKNKQKPKNPRRKHGVMSAAFTAVFIAAVVVLNIIMGILSDRFGLKADLTAAGLYTLDSQTEYYLKYFLNTDITVTVIGTEKHFLDNGEYFKQVNEILHKLDSSSEHITLRYLELEQNPDYAAKFSGETLSDAYIVVENEEKERYRIITPMEFFGLDDEDAMYLYYYYGYIGSSLIEQEAVSAMLYVSDDDPKKIVFTEGFGEHGSDALKKLLTKNGYDVESVNLLTGDIPEDADAVVIYAPNADMNSAQLAKLDKFLDNSGELGKNVFYVASTDQPKTPNIDGFLSDWGLEVGYSVIGHTNDSYRLDSMTYYIHLQQIEYSDFTEESYYKSSFIVGSDLRPVFILDGTSNEFDVLMKTYDKAFLYPLDLDSDEDFDLSSAITGTDGFNDVVISTKKSSAGVSRVCAIGSEALAGNTVMSYANVGNQSFFLEVFDSVHGRNTGISITPKSFEATTFVMSEAAKKAYVIVLCIALPACVVIAGIAVYLRRRHR